MVPGVRIRVMTRVVIHAYRRPPGLPPFRIRTPRIDVAPLLSSDPYTALGGITPLYLDEVKFSF